MPPVPTARLEALKHAAPLQGRTLTDFVVGAAHEAALKAIEEIEILRISADALNDPPKPNAALLRAFEHHRRLVGGK